MGNIVRINQIQGYITDSLGSGGESEGVYAFRPDSSLRNLVYKVYRSGTASDSRLTSIFDILELSTQIDEASREKLNKYCALPTKAVLDSNDNLLGILMPRYGENYFCKGAAISKYDAKLAMYFCNDKKVRNTYGLRPLSPDDRKMIALRCASFIGYLHRYGFVYGDISLSNILIHYERHTPLFIDCDSILNTQKRGDGFIKQGHTQDWVPPEGFVPCNKTTDVYKLALLIIRLFDESSSPFQAKFSSSSARRNIAAVFSTNTLNTLLRAGSETPHSRPSVAELFYALRWKTTP